MVGENPLRLLLVGGAISGGRWDSVLSWFCSGEEVDSSLVLAARVEIDEPENKFILMSSNHHFPFYSKQSRLPLSYLSHTHTHIGIPFLPPAEKASPLLSSEF